MNTKKNSISYLKWFVVPVFFFFITAIPLGIYFEPLTGDLTRIGHWSERDFGWTKPQPAVSVHANGDLITNPQVLVLGDSFSHPNIWQSYLSETQKIEILSFQYQDVGCVTNWLQWVENRPYPNVHTIIIQTVERGLVSLFRNLKTCASISPKSTEVVEETITPLRSKYDLTLDAEYLYPTALNILRMSLSKERIDSAEVINHPLSTDRLFSNKKSDRLLYYSEDDNKILWSEKDLSDVVKNMSSIQTRLAIKNLHLVVLVVPDKSSAYRKYFKNSDNKAKFKDVNVYLKAAGIEHVNLLSFFQQQVERTRDLYLPNDTHLSIQGYKLMAAKIYEEADINTK